MNKITITQLIKWYRSSAHSIAWFDNLSVKDVIRLNKLIESSKRLSESEKFGLSSFIEVPKPKLIHGEKFCKGISHAQLKLVS